MSAECVPRLDWGDFVAAVRTMHDQVIDGVNGVGLAVLEHHRPTMALSSPQCRGCDQEARSGDDLGAVDWPCSTWLLTVEAVHR